MAYIIVKVDINDADYISSFYEISEEGIDFITPLVKEIKKNYYDNFPLRDGMDAVIKMYPDFEEEVEALCSYCDSWECHTLEEVKIIRGEVETIR